MQICERIKGARLRAGMSQQDLANKLDIAQSAVGNWEAGIRIPRTQMLYKIAYALNCSIYDLMPEEDPR